ncbi:GDSL-type esterase/lipase family protein [Nissabacter sp. SGAir0207]|uniref:GDSL-type esterase/lipase family protein n=1 Tax=Nissabacter sp. SGAir0207 TaxID=2126321 RepID=UPI00143DFA27|nr:GDSL-type esterase/lipase family protein [Nissabacter sp. SGAir0207]
MKQVAIGVGLLAAMGYSFALGKYAVFPYNYIYELKHTYFTKEQVQAERNPVYLFKRAMYSAFQGKGDYVMVGDSLTENARWDDIFPDYKIVNRGIAGDDTAGVLERIEDITSTGAKKAFIMLGTNDIDRGVSAEGIANNIILIADKLKAAGMEVVVESTLLSGKTLAQKNSVINDVNRRLVALCAEKQYHYVDINPAMTIDGLLNPEYSVDDTHVNYKGYKAWRTEIANLF